MNLQNLRIIPEAFRMKMSGEVTSRHDFLKTDWGDNLLLDPRTFDNAQEVERALRFIRADKLVFTLQKIAEKYGTDDPENHIDTVIKEIFPSDMVEGAHTTLSSIHNIETAEEKQKAIVDFLTNSNLWPTAEEIGNRAESIRSQLKAEVQKILDRQAEMPSWMFESAEQARAELQPYFDQQNAFEVKPTALEKMTADEARVKKAFEQLPSYLKDIYTSQPQTIAVFSSLLGLPGRTAAMLIDQNIIYLQQAALHDEKDLIFTLREEVFHWVDQEMGITTREEWRQAVEQEISNMSQENRDFVHNALEDKASVCDLPEDDNDDDQERNLMKMLRNLSQGDTKYDSLEGQADELFSDYFQVRDYVASHSKEPMTAEVLNARMQEIFPHTHELCLQYEKEMVEAATTLNRAQVRRK